MALKKLEKLEKLEEAVLHFREKFDRISVERDSVLKKVSTLEGENEGMMKERKVLHDRVGTLIQELEKLGF